VSDDCTCTMTRPMQRDSSGAPISPPEWGQADDCPAHPYLLHCEACGTQAVVLETSAESPTDGRHYLVTRLACGHDDYYEMTSGNGVW